MWFKKLRWNLLARHSGLFTVLAFIAGVIFVWSGFYNVAASRDHWVITTWILERVRVQSVATWSYFVEDPPPLEDMDKIRLGAAHYEGGCAPCHSRPGGPINAIVAGMLPPPPPIKSVLENKDPKELFWIVKHGLKYSAMPAWPAQVRNDEVWALTAFLLALPDMSPEEYRELAAVDRAPSEPEEGERLARASETVALTQCVRCHGAAASGPISDLIPSLGGQSPDYLERALREYAAGTRPSGVMQPVADLLDEAEIGALANYYAELEPSGQSSEADPERIARGRELATNGDPAQGIPACLACHGRNRAAAFPNLAGLSRSYIETQLHVWQSGGRDMTVYGQIMAPIARRLSEEQMKNAAAYFASIESADLPAAVTASSADER